MAIDLKADYTSRGKTVAGLIKKLKTFENQQLEVRISIDGGKTSLPISIIRKSENQYALIINCQKTPTNIKHKTE